MKDQYDVVVIGAGIAGSILAKLLAENKLSVLLVEKDEYSGKSTACGGLFDMPYLERYIKTTDVIEQKITKNVFVLPWGDVIYDCNQVTVKRRIFDRRLAQLAQESGAELLNSTVALKYKVLEPGNVEITLKHKKKKSLNIIQSHIIAFADGPHTLGLNNPKFNSEKNKKFWAYAYAYEVEGVPFASNEMRIYLDSKFIPWGYGWIFPNKNDSNVGVGTILPEMNKTIPLKEKFASFLNISKTTAPLLKDRIILDKKGGFIPMWLLKHFSDDSQVILGDAAGMVSPLFGAGIDYAIDAAEACAPVIIEALKDEDFSKNKLQQYDKKIENGFLKNLRKQMLIARIIIASLKVHKSLPVKLLTIIGFGDKYNRWNKIKILFYPLFGQPNQIIQSSELLSHK